MTASPAPRPGKTISPGDLVALVDDAGRRFLVTVPDTDKPNVERIRGVGVIDTAKLAGEAWGTTLPHGNKQFLLLPAGTLDRVAGLQRNAAIVQPKDAARIVLECDVTPGSLVVEAGIGSAALTTVLARAVGPTGRVVTFEIRDDFRDLGLANLKRAGVADRVDLRAGDVREGMPGVTDADAVILDMPDPWKAVAHAKAALKPGGYFCAYSPLVSQMEATFVALGRAGFAETRVLELIERKWVVGENGSRPDHDMLGHTAFLTLARRVA